MRNFIDDMRYMLSKPPKDFSNWSYQRTIDFKDAVKKAKKVIASSARVYETVANARNALKGFYE